VGACGLTLVAAAEPERAAEPDEAALELDAADPDAALEDRDELLAALPGE
jgi:hypothetical protein